MTLLGQNVNSYRDLSQSSIPLSYDTRTHLSRGFSAIYHTKEGGRRFSDLLEQVSQVRKEKGWEEGEERGGRRDRRKGREERREEGREERKREEGRGEVRKGKREEEGRKWRFEGRGQEFVNLITSVICIGTQIVILLMQVFTSIVINTCGSASNTIFSTKFISSLSYILLHHTCHICRGEGDGWHLGNHDDGYHHVPQSS